MCRHLVQYATADPAPTTPDGCEDCLAVGGTWIHLRVCQVCGHVGCCDSSPGKHASAHFAGTGHPVMRSYEPGENWRWCFRDEFSWEPAASQR
jgi:CPA1 family monovalent cation:H+ antiporter